MVISFKNHASIINKATYECVYSCVDIDDAVQSLSEHLKEEYIGMGLSKRDTENDPWLPINISSFTTPIFVHQKQLQTKKDTEAATHERAFGNIEDIPVVTKIHKLKCVEEIFEPINNSTQPYTILIEGHPGIGKTTLSKEICIKWAKGELLCSDKLVFLLFLRDADVQKINSKQQLIEYFTNEVAPINRYLNEKRGANVTLIIDGFDELNGELCRKSFFTKLVKRILLNRARIVITSRPLASVCFHEVVDRRIEILGFDKSTREQYINEALKNYPDYPKKLKKLQQHLQHYPNIDAVCYIPLVLNILIFLCIQEYLPPTTTEMYTNFILHTICRHLKRKGEMKDDDKVTKVEEFSKPICDVLKMLEKVAFDGLVQGKIVFEEKDLPDHKMCRSDPTCFGLLQSTKYYNPKVFGAPVLTFNFYHLELQEYFAARHIMSLPEDDAYNLIRKYFFIGYPEWGPPDWDPDDDEDISDDDDIGSSKNLSDSGDSQSDQSYSDYSETPDDVRIRFSNVWIYLFGLTKGDFAPLQRHLSSYSDSDEQEEDERYKYICYICNIC